MRTFVGIEHTVDHMSLRHTHSVKHIDSGTHMSSLFAEILFATHNESGNTITLCTICNDIYILILLGIG